MSYLFTNKVAGRDIIGAECWSKCSGPLVRRSDAGGRNTSAKIVKDFSRAF